MRERERERREREKQEGIFAHRGRGISVLFGKIGSQ
jgi:hypothetical protein